MASRRSAFRGQPLNAQPPATVHARRSSDNEPQRAARARYRGLGGTVPGVSCGSTGTGVRALLCDALHAAGTF